MNKIDNKAAIELLKADTKQKIITFASELEISADTLLDRLISDEIERYRLLMVHGVTDKENQKNSVPSQKIANICKKYLSDIDPESEGYAIRTAIENLYEDLLKQKIIFVNTREGDIVESKRLKTSRVDYYWYGGSLAKRIAMCFGTEDVYLWHELFYPYSEVLFVGMPTNVEVCYQLFYYLYRLFKKIKAVSKKNSAHWGSKKEIEEEVNRYMADFAHELDHTRAFIDNDDCDKLLYDYVGKKYAYTMRD
jgi:hypothetical protein